MKVQLTKCYLVQIVSDKGDELTSEYCFTDRAGAQRAGVRMLEEIHTLHAGTNEPIPFEELKALPDRRQL